MNMKFWDTTIETFSYDKSRSELIHNLDTILGMSVEEQTLYKKWIELNQDLHSSFQNLPALAKHYDTIWKPTDIMNKELTISEINNIQPVIQIVEDSDEASKWSDVRRMIHTMEFQANPGRNVKIYVKDRDSGKLLGLISLGSDITSLGVRDQYIGWSKEDKFVNGKLNNTTIATSIVSTQPFGYNFLGGKLIAALTTAPEIRDYWKQKYDNVLIGVGTTSLYGIHSMYNGIPHFKTLGESKGKISIKPDDKYYDVWHQWLKDTHADWYEENITNERIRNGQNMGLDTTGPVSGIKQKILTKIFRELGIKADAYHHGFQRGVYYANLYENGNEYLCSKIDENDLVLKKKFMQGIDYTMHWWKPKAINRYERLHSENKLKPETLFYYDVVGMSWERCKEKYLGEVGR
jgi:hypothetical protein